MHNRSFFYIYFSHFGVVTSYQAFISWSPLSQFNSPLSRFKPLSPLPNVAKYVATKRYLMQNFKIKGDVDETLLILDVPWRDGM